MCPYAAVPSPLDLPLPGGSSRGRADLAWQFSLRSPSCFRSKILAENPLPLFHPNSCHLLSFFLVDHDLEVHGAQPLHGVVVDVLGPGLAADGDQDAVWKRKEGIN